MGTMVGIIYGNVDRLIHRIVKPANDTALSDPKLVVSGETMSQMVKSTYNGYSSNKAIATALGLLG